VSFLEELITNLTIKNILLDIFRFNYYYFSGLIVIMKIWI